MWNFFWRLPRRIVQTLIAVYQRTLSPDHGWMSRFFPYRVCRYHPTCSEYGFEVIGKCGVIKGVPLMIWRILRCNPWNKGGFDPVP
jgi:hypothetical protein